MTDRSDSNLWNLYRPEPWGPTSSGHWRNLDQLDKILSERHAGEYRLTSAETSYLAWLRLPRRFRRQAWREREIAARVFSLEEVWQRLPGFHGVGVALRRLNGKPTLSVTLSTDVASADAPNWVYDIPDSMDVPSIVPGLRDTSLQTVPIVVEERPQESLLGGVVEPVVLSTGASPDHKPTIQSGLGVAGEDKIGFLTPGTLGAILRDNNGEFVLLGSNHVFNQQKIVFDGRPATQIGTVVKSHHELDAAIASLGKPYKLDLRLPAPALIPSPPVHPRSGMPVQMNGAVSGHKLGHIHESHYYPLTAHRLGHISRMTVFIDAVPGDSGALLVSGHHDQPAGDPAEARYMGGYFDYLICSMLGILQAGPSPGAHSTTLPVASFASILQIFDALNVEPLVVERREAA